MGIPRIIHLMWLDVDPLKHDIHKAPKALYREYTQRIKDLHPEYQHMWWNTKNTRELFSHPQLRKYREVFEALPENIMKCDMARYALLWIHGGFYFDLDTYLHRALPEEWHQEDLMFFQEPAYQSGGRVRDLYPETGYSSVVSNQPLGSEPGHPFWLKVLDEIADKLEGLGDQYFWRRWKDKYFPGRMVVDTTGPIMLTEMIKREGYLDRIKSPCWFFGTDKEGDEMRCGVMHGFSPECQNGSFCTSQELENAVGSNVWDEGTGWNSQYLWMGWLIWIVVVIVILVIVGFVVFHFWGPKAPKTPQDLQESEAWTEASPASFGPEYGSIE